jgi:acetolactate synthase regulatory subunit
MHRFHIDAIADPQSLPRVAGAFAQRGIIPDALSARFDGNTVQIEVTVAGLHARQAAIIAAKLGETVAAIAVRLEAMEEVFA